MKTKLMAPILGVVLLLPVSAMANDMLLLPLVAHDLQGFKGNRWSSEFYLTNPGSEEVTVYFGHFIVGKREPEPPCTFLIAPSITVPAGTTSIWNASDIGLYLGCVDQAVGALRLSVTGPVHVSSRIVNHRHDPSDSLLSGFGQQIDAVAEADLPLAASYVLPSLVWHRNSCGPVKFDTYLGVANPSGETVLVTIDLGPESEEPALLLGGQEVLLPHTIEVPPWSWRHVHVQPAANMLPVCMDPELFDLHVDVDGRAAIYGSVVDRLYQDPRTVNPVAME